MSVRGGAASVTFTYRKRGANKRLKLPNRWFARRDPLT